MARPNPYPSMFERLVANTLEPENSNGCWLWAGSIRNHRGSVTVRVPGVKHPLHRAAHRVMLEEVLQAEFPFDEGGHLCYVERCANPDHLEVQTKAFNLAERRGYSANVDGCFIPALFPRRDLLDEAACEAWDNRGTVGDPAEIPF